FPFRVSPGEVGIGLRESQLRKTIHDVWPRKRFRQKNEIPVLVFEIPDHPLPEIERFGVRVVDAENTHTLLNPEFNNGFQFLPKRTPMRCLEIERINILVFFRRILCILNGPVRPMPKPFRMLLHIRMIRGTLIREIECNIDSVLFSGANEMVKVVQRAEVGREGLVPAENGTDRPWTSRFTRPRCSRVVFSFSKAFADRMNGREIQNVKTHLRDLRQQTFTVFERA